MRNESDNSTSSMSAATLSNSIYRRPVWPAYHRFRYDPARDRFVDRVTEKVLTRRVFNALWGSRHSGASRRRSADREWLEYAPPECFIRTVNADVIPDELRKRPHWVCYRLGETRANGKPAKRPVNPRTGRAAAVDDSATWTTFEAAERAARLHGWGGGFVLTADDDLVVVDIDDVLTTEGEFRPDILRMVDKFNSFTEVSVSGRGLHIWLHGKKPGERCRRGCIELYSHRRFIVVTGDHLSNTPATVNHASDVLLKLYQWIDCSSPPLERKASLSTTMANRTDANLLDRARHSGSGAKFTRLYDDGDLSEYGGDHSAADLALVRMLSYWTDGDAARIDALYRQSALMRPKKWDSRRGDSTYGALTIARVLGG